MNISSVEDLAEWNAQNQRAREVYHEEQRRIRERLCMNWDCERKRNGFSQECKPCQIARRERERNQQETAA